MKYTDRLAEAYDRTKSIVCVGFDPDLKRIPVKDNDTEERIIRFFAELID
ncbi:MAG: orotidine 5'-phosphate decarboxylase, partial [Nanoarchaeota archaeon]